MQMLIIGLLLGHVLGGSNTDRGYLYAMAAHQSPPIVVSGGGPVPTSFQAVTPAGMRMVQYSPSGSCRAGSCGTYAQRVVAGKVQSVVQRPPVVSEGDDTIEAIQTRTMPRPVPLISGGLIDVLFSNGKTVRYRVTIHRGHAHFDRVR